MKYRYGKRGWLLTLAGVASVTALGAWAANASRYVSVIALPLHQQPTAYSETVGTLSYGAPVQVLREIDAPRKDTGDLPPWAEVESGGQKGFVPAGCLVSSRLLAKQSNISEAEVNSAQRRFSEEEAGDLKTMKGLGGGATGGAANTAAVDGIIAGSAQFSDVKTRFSDFRKQGHLGEFSE